MWLFVAFGAHPGIEYLQLALAQISRTARSLPAATILAFPLSTALVLVALSAGAGGLQLQARNHFILRDRSCAHIAESNVHGDLRQHSEITGAPHIK
jgi:hypothetical protein